MTRQQIGKKGEGLAIQWLLYKDYKIIAKNWRSGRFEIDVIAEKDNVVHCVEVKTTTGTGFGYPEGNIRERKLKNIRQAAELYTTHQHPDQEVQMDVLAITILKSSINFYFIENIL